MPLVCPLHYHRRSKSFTIHVWLNSFKALHKIRNTHTDTKSTMTDCQIHRENKWNSYKKSIHTHTQTKAQLEEHLTQLHQQKMGSITLIGTAHITQTEANTIQTKILTLTTHPKRHLVKNSTEHHD